MAALSAVEMARSTHSASTSIERCRPKLADHPAYPLRIVWCLAILLIATWRSDRQNLVDDANQHMTQTDECLTEILERGISLRCR